MLERVPKRVTLYEVGLRDGLQNEERIVPTGEKLELLGALLAAGHRAMEVTSFVSPRWIPQLADAEELAANLPERPEVRFGALVANARGLARAKEAGIREIAIVLSVSDTHSRRNINRSTREARDAYVKLCASALNAGIRVRGYLSTVWGCPYEGEVPAARSVELARALFDMGCYQISLGDTIGVGDPAQTERLLGAVLARIPLAAVALHLHDTHGRALANALVGLQMGIETFDSSIGGLGGCPYAPGASGNLATEELAAMLERMGIATGLDGAALINAAKLAERAVGHALPGRHLKAVRAAGVAGVTGEGGAGARSARRAT